MTYTSYFYTLLITYFLIVFIYAYFKIFHFIRVYDKGTTLSNRVMIIPTIIISRNKREDRATDWELVFALFNKRYYICIHSFKLR